MEKMILHQNVTMINSYLTSVTQNDKDAEVSAILCNVVSAIQLNDMWRKIQSEWLINAS